MSVRFLIASAPSSELGVMPARSGRCAMWQCTTGSPATRNALASPAMRATMPRSAACAARAGVTDAAGSRMPAWHSLMTSAADCGPPGPMALPSLAALRV